MRSRITLSCCSALASLALLVTACGSSGSSEANYPTKPIELVTHNQPGAVMDVMGRLIADIVQQEKLLNQPLTVVNKPGAGGGASFGYMLEKKGDAHTILAMPAGNLLNLPLTDDLPYSYKDFTPIANLIADGAVLVVRADSPYKTMDDLVEAARQKPKQLNMSVTSLITSQAMAARQIATLKGVEWNYVTFASVPEGVLAVINKTVDFGFANPAYTRDHVRAGTLRVLLTGALERYEGEMSAPTMAELNLGDVRVSYRGFWGPPEMPSYAVKKMEDTLKKVMDTQRFKDYMAQNMMQPAFRSSAEFAKLLDKENETAKKDLAAAGMLKKK